MNGGGQSHARIEVLAHTRTVKDVVNMSVEEAGKMRILFVKGGKYLQQLKRAGKNDHLSKEREKCNVITKIENCYQQLANDHRA